MVSRNLILVASLLVLFAPAALAQQIYKWKDIKGQWHFSDHPPPEVRAEKVKGLDIGPIPPMPPQIAEPPTPHAGSESTEQAVSKPRLTEEVSREQRRYQKRLEEMAQQIKALKKRYDLIADQLTGAGGFKKLAPGESIVILRSGKIVHYPKRPTRPGVLPPGHDARSIIPRDKSKGRELTRLGNKLERLYEKRDKLVREMRRKGFETGYIPY